MNDELTMDFFDNCNTSSLAPYTVPLDRQRAEHLYRRLGFSASVGTIDQAIGQSASTLVDKLIDQAIKMVPLAPPTWADWTSENYPDDDDLHNQLKNDQKNEWTMAYTNTLIQNNLRDRLSFFWSNHLVTELEVYDFLPFLYYYTNCLQRNAIGNFRTFIHEMGTTSAMLYYLDGAYNKKGEANENYGRELFELFTMGEGNGYTEEDIIETSRALTGYVNRGTVGGTPVIFDPSEFDEGSKTIFGQTGNWGYDDVINILFTERPNEIANFICIKLYEFFVHPDSDDDAGNAEVILQGMANTFVQNNFEIVPVLSQLFKSQHFFDDEAIGVIIKSPFDISLNLVSETNFAYTDEDVAFILNSCRMLGQELFDPLEVQGWQRNRTWINTNFMIGRWITTEVLLERFWQNDKEQFRTLAMHTVGMANSGTSNPKIVTETLINKFLPKGLLTEADFNNALSVFTIEDVPETYYGSDYIPGGQGIWILNISMEVPTQVYLLLLHLVRQPEFQLK